MFGLVNVAIESDGRAKGLVFVGIHRSGKVRCDEITVRIIYIMLNIGTMMSNIRLDNVLGCQGYVRTALNNELRSNDTEGLSVSATLGVYYRDQSPRIASKVSAATLNGLSSSARIG